MKKYLFFCIILLTILVSCKENDTNIVKTYEQTPADKAMELWNNSEYVTKITYYEMSDGTFEANGRSYKYKLEISGTLNNAVKESSYIVLSNIEKLTFEQVWKASGLSSITSDYFKPEDAIIVAIK